MFTYLLIVLIVVYSIRVAVYLGWLYLETEETIKHSKKFEHKSSTSTHDVLFIGDSLTYGVGASIPEKSIAGLFHKENPNCNVSNKSVNKITTKGLLEQIEKYQEANRTYRYSVLSIGGNDIVQLRSMRGIKERIEHIISVLDSVSEDVYILTPTKPGKSPLIIKLLIYHRVKKLRQIVQSLKITNVHHVDMWEPGDRLLANPKEYFVKDTLHLSDAGQRKWYEQLKKSMET